MPAIVPGPTRVQKIEVWIEDWHALVKDVRITAGLITIQGDLPPEGGLSPYASLGEVRIVIALPKEAYVGYGHVLRFEYRDGTYGAVSFVMELRFSDGAIRVDIGV